MLSVGLRMVSNVTNPPSRSVIFQIGCQQGTRVPVFQSTTEVSSVYVRFMALNYVCNISSVIVCHSIYLLIITTI